MDIYLDFITKLKIVLKFIVHKYQQFLTTTYEFEIVNTSKGPVRGRKRINIHSEYGKYYAFEGIPFAKPPLGKLRFRAPQPPEPWKEVLDCTNYKAKPMQYNYAFKLKEGSEDCLYLNVYARELHTAKPLPVMVWIYGGGFQIGEASRDMYAPDYFMQRDVILVTFNYRLGIFGFLCFDDPELNIPGNAGLKDQVLALRWVKHNIHNFNGDANNITVFGESAGGASTHFLMSIPRAKGLFHKAIVQSASMLCPWATTENHDWGYKTACIMGYNGDKSSKCVYDYLSRKSSHDLYLANYQLRTKERDMRNVLSFFIPVVEPYATDECVISKPPKELLAEAWGNEIPLIIGGVLDEGFIFYNMARHVPYIINELGECLELMPDDLKHSRNEDELKEMAFRLKQLYFDGKDPNIRDNFYHFLELMGHRMIWHPIVRTLKARLKYASLAPTYVYTFDFDSNFFNHHRTVHCGRGARGVCHGDDLVYLFYGILSEKLSTSSREYQCLQRMVGMWYNFALTSNPNCQEIEPVIWQPLGDCEEPLKCLSICDTLKHKELPKYEKLKIWNEFYKREEFI